MTKLYVKTQTDVEYELEGVEGASVMETIRNAGIDDLLALCGGCCSCATCHVYVQRDWQEKLPPMSDDENDLLDASAHRNEQSRLSCQIPLTTELSGLVVQIAPED